LADAIRPLGFGPRMVVTATRRRALLIAAAEARLPIVAGLLAAVEARLMIAVDMMAASGGGLRHGSVRVIESRRVEQYGRGRR